VFKQTKLILVQAFFFYKMCYMVQTVAVCYTWI